LKPDLDEWAASIVGKTIAEKYHVESEIGRGGMGGVFLARHGMLGDRRFAIKLIIPNRDMGPPEEQERRFAREAATALTFVHPRAVQVRDFGFDHANEVMYMAMDLVEGRSLKDVIDEAAATKRQGEPPIPFARSLVMVLKVLDALKAAHKAQVVHRDLKPGNVMVVDNDGEEDVKILDFGFAKVIHAAEGRDTDGEKALAEEQGVEVKDLAEKQIVKKQTFKRRTTSRIFSEELSTASVVVGTPHYMAPEQARGSDVDQRADLYSLGVILFEMLTGTLPHTGSSSHSLLMARASAPAPSLDEARPDIEFPPEIQILSEYALAHDPNDRFQNAARFAASVIEALQAIGAQVPNDLMGTQRSDTARFAALTDADITRVAAAARTADAGSRRGPYRLIAGLAATATVAVLAAVLVLGRTPQGDRIGRAQSAVSLGKYDEAIKILQAALEEAPGNAETAELLRSVQITKALMAARQAVESDDLPGLRTALEEARRLGANAEDLRDLSDQLAAKTILVETDAAIGERRFSQAAQLLDGLPNPLPRGMSVAVAGRRSKIDEALARAEELLGALGTAANADTQALQRAAASLKTFLSEFPAHPKGPVARAELGKILAAIDEIERRAAAESRRTRVSVSTRPAGLICREGEHFLGNTPLDMDNVLEPGTHTLALVDADGFVSRHRVDAAAGRATQVFFDHANAVVPEVALFQKVLDARESGVRLEAACGEYLREFPQGAKRAQVASLLEGAKSQAAQRENLKAEAAYATMRERIESAAPPEMIAALGAFLDRHGSSEKAAEARALLQRLTEGEDARRAVMGVLDDYAAASQRREEAVRSFLTGYSEPEFGVARRDVLRSLLARPVVHEGKVEMLAPVGRSSFVAYSADTGILSIHSLPTGKLIARTELGKRTVTAVDGRSDGRVLVAVDKGDVFSWGAGEALAKVASLKERVGTLLSLEGDRFVAAGGREDRADLVYFGGKALETRPVCSLKGRVLAGGRSEGAKLFALGTDSGEVVLMRDVNGKYPAVVWRKRLDGPVASLSISPSSATMAVGVFKGGRLGAKVCALKDGKAEDLIEYTKGHVWMQALDDIGTVVTAGWLLLPSAPNEPVAVRFGAHPVLDAGGEYLVSVTADGNAVVSYLPELIRHAVAMRGKQP
jgi:serine/threonine protein kinase